MHGDTPIYLQNISQSKDVAFLARVGNERATEMSKAVLKLNSDHYTIVALYLLTVCIFLLFPQVSRYKANPKTKTKQNTCNGVSNINSQGHHKDYYSVFLMSSLFDTH